MLNVSYCRIKKKHYYNYALLHNVLATPAGDINTKLID